MSHSTLWKPFGRNMHVVPSSIEESRRHKTSDDEWLFSFHRALLYSAGGYRGIGMSYDFWLLSLERCLCRSSILNTSTTFCLWLVWSQDVQCVLLMYFVVLEAYVYSSCRRLLFYGTCVYVGTQPRTTLCTVNFHLTRGNGDSTGCKHAL